jgi:hypothetical protein
MFREPLRALRVGGCGSNGKAFKGSDNGCLQRFVLQKMFAPGFAAASEVESATLGMNIIPHLLYTLELLCVHAREALRAAFTRGKKPAPDLEPTDLPD